MFRIPGDRTGRFRRAGLAGVLAGTVLAGPAVAAPPATGPQRAPLRPAAVPVPAAPPPVARAPQNCAEPGQPVTEVPWAQLALTPERVWPFTTGAGTTVAVLSSGVDAGHPQLRGRVAAGLDAVAGSGPADDDCLGLGTQVAGLIAARQTDSQGFAGLAPGARILPVRVLDDAGFGRPQVDPAVLARGIGWAVDQRVAVIAVPIPVYEDAAAVRAAVTRAVQAGIVVVAAAGDEGGADAANPTPFPAGYEGVLGVGAIGPTGARWDDSQHGPYVDLVAPGDQILTLQRGSGLTGASGTGLATGFVAATAALVRNKRGALDPGQIERLILGTAVPAPAGPGFGRGIVNPYAAVNDMLAGGGPAALPGLTPSEPVTDAAWLRSRDVAVVGALGAVLLVVLVWAGAVALPRARRRSWRAAVAPPTPRGGEPVEPGPPIQLFDGSPTGPR
ncbi:S8 family serine peptidase [Polymorphospora rubra]|uniref:Peptidase S8 n=1 Tax=Polymorphospora rubra TaxID=338584 RepID=A0A810N6N8_9ACTN|nr:S8 family serine peptidase [Polymorphospora rubra]BCJ68650.1 peptidase S8 [Polymorphospora rubra]